MGITPSLPLLSGPPCPGVVLLDRVLSMGQKELFNLLLGIIIMSHLKFNCCMHVICIRKEYLINRITNVK